MHRRLTEGVLSTTATIVVDSHAPFRAGVAELLDDSFTIVGEASSVSELERLVAEAPEVRLVLIGATNDGDLAAAVAAIPEQARFVVFANEARRTEVLRALNLGASGYLLKGIRGETLSPTLHAIMDGSRAHDGPVGALIEAYLERRARRGYVLLRSGKRVPVSPREQQVANLLSQGASTRAIAEELGISVVTVRRHVSSLMRKLDVVSRDRVTRLLAA